MEENLRKINRRCRSCRSGTTSASGWGSNRASCSGVKTGFRGGVSWLEENRDP